jgi:hypothetical protein
MSPIYLMKDDEFTCSFSQVDPEGVLNGDFPKWIDFKKDKGPENKDDRAFMVAAAVVNIGERTQRRTVERKITKGTRNITNRGCRSARYLGLAQNPEMMASDDRKEKRGMLKKCQEQLNEVVVNARTSMGWEEESPSRWSYVITEDVLDEAEDAGCEAYFENISGQRFFAEDLNKIEVAVKGLCPESSMEVIQVLRRTKTDEHLSMISLKADENGGLFITVVDPKGHYLTVEADRFVEMLNADNQSRRLHVFPSRGHRQPVTFAFNENTEGEIIGKFMPEVMKLDVVCCQGQGQYSNVHDRSWFYLDPEYLMCMWVVLCRLGDDRDRYKQQKSMAEARVEFDPFSTGASL